MKLVERIMTKNPCYTAGKKITVKGLMLHSVGCPQPRAEAFISNWNSASYDRACVHGFIDGNDGTVYQTLPWNHRGWHAGGAANNTHIGVEMCEPACIKYVGGATFECSDLDQARAVAERTYKAVVELFTMLCKKFNLNPHGDGVIISHAEGCKRGVASNHGDPEHLWRQLGMNYTMDTFRNAVAAALGSGEVKKEGTQASRFAGLSEKDAVAIIGPLCREDMKKSGILASVSTAQFILESGFGKSELAQNANNCFGMKTSLSGNSWSGSAWDGKSKYTKKTKEEYKEGVLTEIIADFRKYPCVEDSISDHSAYLIGAKNGSKLRYAGIKGMTDYKKVAQLIKEGGYATSLTYVEKLCGIIEKWDLTVFDANSVKENTYWYRVRKSWSDAKSQVGAYTVLENAKAEVEKNPGYYVFDMGGNIIYSPKNQSATSPFMVKVSISDLNIRKGPGTDYAKTGKYTGVGVFTIIEVKPGKGADDGWGRLKSGAGWISLDFCQRVQ